VKVPKLELPIERFELSCGAVLLVSRRPSAPVVAAYAHMRGGPALDPAGFEGTAYLTGALADQGTAHHDEEQLANLLEPAGGEVSGDASGLAGTIVVRDWELLLDVLCEELVEPSFPKAKVERQKKRLLDRLEVERDEPRTQGGLLFRKLVYGDHWLGRPAYGTVESVKRVEPKHLRTYHRANWVAKRAIIAVCGDVDPLAIKKRMERNLARWTPGTALATSPPKLPERATRVSVFPADRQQVHLYLGHLGIQRGDPDYAALVVMDHVLGTGPGFTNRISRKLRDELGLAYSVNANIHSSAGILPGMFTAYIGTSPEHVDTAVKGFLAEIQSLQAMPPSREELEVAKSYLLGSFPLGFERASRRASYMVSAELHKFPADNLERLLVQFASVTAEDVQRVARTHLHPSASCLVASGPVRREDLVRALRTG
jgi:zinc protease